MYICIFYICTGIYIYCVQVQDRNDLGVNFKNAYGFPCNVSASANYDVTNGAKSPRNSAYKWASEALALLRRTSNSKIDFDVRMLIIRYNLMI